MERSELVEVVKSIVGFLNEEKYTELLENDFVPRMTSSEPETAIKNYGGKVTVPADDKYEIIDIYQVGDKDKYSVDFDLWIDGSLSDLTLSLTIVKEHGTVHYSIDDCHVL